MSVGPRELWHRLLAGITSPRFVRAWAGFPLALGGPRVPAAPFDLKCVRRLLVIRFDGMGDLVVSSAFFRELRRAAPQAKITLLIRSEWMPLLQGCPHYDELLGFTAMSYPAYQNLHRHRDALSFARRELWPRRFEAALVPQVHFNDFEARVLAYLSGAPTRIGRGAADGGASDAGINYLTRAVADAPRAHEVEQTLHFLEALGARAASDNLELWLEKAVTDAGVRRAEQLRGDCRRLIALGIGASQPERIWPIAKFIELGRWLHSATGARVLAIGGRDLARPGEQLAASLGAAGINLAGKLTLPETAALLGGCDLFIGNDSGPMHLAAATGIPVVELSGFPADGPEMHAGSPKRIGPWCARRAIVQPRSTGGAPGFFMEDIRLSDVQSAVGSLLGV
jgi:ADP-heptose:LPS heptosyltransferase